jgi:acetyltransferase
VQLHDEYELWSVFRRLARILKDGGVPCYSFPTTAAKAMGALYRYSKIRAREIGSPAVYNEMNTKIAEIALNQSKNEGRSYLTADRVYDLLTAYGIPVPRVVAGQ